jgi:site-specific DNA-methyltransferase (adenine-specific)
LNQKEVQLYNEECIGGVQKWFESGSVDLLICDPPFGISESQFDKHYNRKPINVVEGYVEAPKEYDKWTFQWMSEAKRVLSENGSFYVIIGHTNLRHVLNAASKLGFHEVNHIIWKYNFGVATKSKFVTAHYHVLYYTKSKTAKPTFNTFCRFGTKAKDESGGSLLYQDLEDVFVINREYAPGEQKNQNKLPEELIKKLIAYSSKPDDLVCDFFMGNFTTAYAARKLGRRVCGFEINKVAYDLHVKKVDSVEYGCDLTDLREIDTPENQGNPISQEEASAIYEDFIRFTEAKGMTKKKANQELQKKYQRGKFSIHNIITRMLEEKPVDFVNRIFE